MILADADIVVTVAVAAKDRLDCEEEREFVCEAAGLCEIDCDPLVVDETVALEDCVGDCDPVSCDAESVEVPENDSDAERLTDVLSDC